ncbi:MAG: ArsR family transcriptional regulator, partial [Gammaproteobacteria bacterium]|nr:ArsR family transcriptional regulator [Gammaproteobacteria bacterium]
MLLPHAPGQHHIDQELLRGLSSRCCKIDTVTRSESRCASELTRILGQSQPGVSRHLR